MKYKIAELEGEKLDAAVALARGFGPVLVRQWMADPPPKWAPSTDWAKGGPIIFAEQISTTSPDLRGPPHTLWLAEIMGSLAGPVRAEAEGKTPLIAAMRAFAMSGLLGDEVELP